MNIQEKRQHLKTLSVTVRSLVDEGKYPNINEAIIKEIYTDKTHQVFKTFNQWNEEGKTVKKGEKAFLVWGMPVDRKDTEATEETTEEEDTKQFFPLAYLFSNAQIVERQVHHA